MFAGKTAAPTGKAALASEVARNAVFVEQCRKEEYVESALTPLLHRCWTAATPTTYYYNNTGRTCCWPAQCYGCHDCAPPKCCSCSCSCDHDHY